MSDESTNCTLLVLSKDASGSATNSKEGFTKESNLDLHARVSSPSNVRENQTP
jgi:hypothetical protein